MTDDKYTPKKKPTAPEGPIPASDYAERITSNQYFPSGKELVDELKEQEGSFPDLASRVKSRMTKELK